MTGMVRSAPESASEAGIVIVHRCGILPGCSAEFTGPHLGDGNRPERTYRVDVAIARISLEALAMLRKFRRYHDNFVSGESSLGDVHLHRESV